MAFVALDNGTVLRNPAFYGPGWMLDCTTDQPNLYIKVKSKATLEGTAWRKRPKALPVKVIGRPCEDDRYIDAGFLVPAKVFQVRLIDLLDHTLPYSGAGCMLAAAIPAGVEVLGSGLQDLDKTY
jgi:hypothetical protein